MRTFLSSCLYPLHFQYGLYASIVPGFLYTVFGTIKEVTIGPTAVNALISYNYAGPRDELYKNRSSRKTDSQ